MLFEMHQYDIKNMFIGLNMKQSVYFISAH